MTEKILIDKAELQKALEALEYIDNNYMSLPKVGNEAITALREALEQQPTAWIGLTDEEINLFINGRGDEDDDDYVEPTGDGFGVTDADLKALVRRAEAMLREKNGGKE